MPPVANSEQIKRIMKAIAPFFTEKGITFTDDQIDEMLNQEPSDEVRKARKLVEMVKESEKLVEKYPRLDKDARVDLFDRIYDAMLSDGTDDASVKKNQELQKLSATRDGQEEIVVKATEAVLNLNPEILIGTPEQLFQNYIDHPREMGLAFIASSIWQSRRSFANKKAIDENLSNKYNENQYTYEAGGAISMIAQCEANPLYQLLPKDTDFNALLSQVSSRELMQKSGVQLSPEDFGYLINFLGDATQTNIHKAELQEDVARYVKNKKITIGALKGDNQNLTFLDDKGNLVSDDTVVEYNQKYAVVNEYGAVRGIQIGTHAEPEQIEAELPDSFNRKNQQQFNEAMKKVRLLNRLSSKVSGVYGKTLVKTPEFEKTTPELKDCDYTVPEHVSDELSECITMGAFLTPQIFENLGTGSSHAGETVENRIEYGAFDWIGDDERGVGIDQALANVRRGVGELFVKAEAKDTKDIQAAFMNIAQIVAEGCLEINDVKKDETYTVLTLAEKLAKVIEQNPYGIANELKPEVKNAIYMKANLLQVHREEAETRVSLLYGEKQNPETKRATIIRAIACSELRKMHEKGVEYPDTYTLAEEIGKPLGRNLVQTYGDVQDEGRTYCRDYRLHNPSEMDRAMAQKYPELLSAVEAAIPKEEIDKLVSLPGVLLAKELEKVKFDPKKVEIPKTTKNVDEKLLGAMKTKFVTNATVLAKRGADQAEADLDNGVVDNFETGRDRIENYMTSIRASLTHTKPGIMGPSYEFEMIEKCFDVLDRTYKNPNKTANTYVAAKKLANFCQKYLDAKTAKGVDPTANDRAGKRFRDVENILKNANRVASHAKTLNEMKVSNEITVNYATDMLTVSDAIRVSNLHANLLLARKAMDEADPLFHHSSPQFKAVSRALNDCIRQLKDYGKNGIVAAGADDTLAESLSRLDLAAFKYMNDRAYVTGNLAIRRLDVIKQIFHTVDGQDQLTLSRKTERMNARDTKLTEIMKQENEAAVKAESKKKTDKEASLAREKISNNVKVYNNNKLCSKEFDTNREVTKLANRVNTSFEYVESAVDSPKKLVFSKELKQVRSMVADRMLFDMIAKERAEFKDATFEKCFAANPKQVKKSLLAHPETTAAIDQYVTGNLAQRADAIDSLKKTSGEFLKAARKELLEKNAPNAEKNPKQLVEEANVNLPQ